MNPGPILEKSVAVAGEAVSALKASPVLLAVVLLQFLVIGAILYSSIHRQEAVNVQFERLAGIIDKCIGGK